MHWVWLAIAIVSGAPLAYASLLLNPLVFFALGSDRWQEQLARAKPYRLQLAFAAVVFAFAVVLFVLSG
ncbi:MAG: hypothetical protein ABUS54_14920 [Actinomycetota bacterium]